MLSCNPHERFTAFLYHREEADSAEYLIKLSHVEVAGLTLIPVPLSLLWKTSLSEPMREKWLRQSHGFVIGGVQAAKFTHVRYTRNISSPRVCSPRVQPSQSHNRQHMIESRPREAPTEGCDFGLFWCNSHFVTAPLLEI